jgi:hypothetical protein
MRTPSLNFKSDAVAVFRPLVTPKRHPLPLQKGASHGSKR